MNSLPESPPRVLLLVVAQGSYEHWDQLDQIEAAAKELVDVLSAPGSRFQWELQSMLHGGTAPELITELARWLEANVTEKDRLIIYWTGHATRSAGFYLLLRNSPRGGLNATNAVIPEVLADVVGNCRAEKKLLFIDTCYSGGGVADFAQKIHGMFAGRTFSPGQTPYIALIPSTHSLLKSTEAVFCRALREVLAATEAKFRTWDDDDEWVSAGALRDALYQTLQEQAGVGWQPPLPFSAGYGERFVPNPRYRANLRLDVETVRLLRARPQIPEALRLAGRGTVRGETGLYFTGRTAVRQKLASWLCQLGPGLAVLTGLPGAGKSAVLGRLLLAADPDFESEAAAGLKWAEDVPLPPQSIGAAVHVRRKTDEETAQVIARQFLLDWTEEPGALERLLKELRAQSPKGAIVIDALDEAAAPFAIGTLVRRLVEEGNCRVLVGTRRNPDGRVTPPQEERHERLRRLFGEAAEVTDLGDETQTDADITVYVRQRLGQSCHANAAEAIERVAQNVAAQAQGSFLYARIVARTLQEAETLEGRLPIGPVAALAEDIQQRFPKQAEMVHGLFRGLAWAEGEGVSRRSWPAIASALTNGKREFTAAEVTWALDNVGWHIVQGQEDGQTVFRLVHQAFTDHYRQQPASYGAAHREIASRLGAGISGLGWLDADPYVHRYLSVHSRRGELLAHYAKDSGYLVTAKPGPLISRLYGLHDSTAERIAQIYRRAVHGFPTTKVPERMALLELVARQNEPELKQVFKPLLRPGWRCLWAHWRPGIPSVVVGQEVPGPAAIYSPSDPDGSPLLITGRGREVRIWELEQMREVPQRALLEGIITTIAVDNSTETPWAIVGTNRGELAVFSIPDFVRVEYRHDVLQDAVRQLAACYVNAKHYVAAVDEGQSLTLWTLEGLQLVAHQTDATPPDPFLLAATWRGNPVIVTSGDALDDRDGNPIRIWSVPELSMLARFGKEAGLVEQMQVITVDHEAILLGWLGNKVHFWKLETGELVPNSDGRVQSGYFLPLATEPGRVQGLSALHAQVCLLTIESTSGGISLMATPGAEADYGRWFGPIRLWRDTYALSLHHEIRVWNCRDLLAAIEKAPANYEALYRWQRKFGFSSIAAGAGQLFAARDSGTLHCFKADSGEPGWEHPLSDRPLKICYIASSGREIVAVAAEHRIEFFDPAGPRVVKHLAVAEKFIDMQVVNFNESQCLAVLLGKRENDDPRHHRVAILHLPDFKEIDTRDSRGRNRFFLGNHYRHIEAMAVGETDTGQVIVVGDRSQICVWHGMDFGKILLLRPWLAPRTITSIGVIPHAAGGRFVTGTEDGTIALLSCVEDPILVEKRPGGRFAKVALVPWRGRPAIASGSRDEKLRLWTMELELLEEIDLGAWINQIVAVSPEIIAVATNRGIVVIESSSPEMMMHIDGGNIPQSNPISA